MRLTNNGALRSALFCLLLTSFVTACVKNDHKDEAPAPVSDELVLQQQSLLTTGASDGDLQTVKVDNATGKKKIIQE